MDLKQVAKDTAKVLQSYLTYQALRAIVAQLSETNPAKAYWLQSFSSQAKLQDGEAYLNELLAAEPEMGFRLMTVREHLAAEVADFLPEMVVTGIQQANMEHRRRQLERLTQFVLDEDPEFPAHADLGRSDVDRSDFDLSLIHI